MVWGNGGSCRGVDAVKPAAPVARETVAPVAREPVAPVARESVAPAARLATEPVTLVARVPLPPTAAVAPPTAAPAPNCFLFLSLFPSAAVERQVLPLSPAVPSHAAAASTCSPGDLPPHAPASAASTLAERLVQLNLPPLHRLSLLLPAVAVFSALGVPLREEYCTWF
ncbi:unnamed protein product [Closterium sp. NIES-54]